MEGIWMLRHYSYDGYGRHDQYDVWFEFDKYKAADNFLDMAKDFDDYSWTEWGKDKEQVLCKREGEHAYDYYCLEFMSPGEEID
jgi:hypothetical protein